MPANIYLQSLPSSLKSRLPTYPFIPNVRPALAPPFADLAVNPPHSEMTINHMPHPTPHNPPPSHTVALSPRPPREPSPYSPFSFVKKCGTPYPPSFPNINIKWLTRMVSVFSRDSRASSALCAAGAPLRLQLSTSPDRMPDEEPRTPIKKRSSSSKMSTGKN